MFHHSLLRLVSNEPHIDMFWFPPHTRQLPWQRKSQYSGLRSLQKNCNNLKTIAPLPRLAIREKVWYVVIFWSQVSFGGREGVGDFTSRVVESFSDLSLGPLNLSDSRAMHKVQTFLIYIEFSMWKFRLAKFTQNVLFHLGIHIKVKTQVQSMPELKSVSLTVGRKALHSKPAGFNSPSNRSFNRFPYSALLLDISSFNFSFNSPGTRSFNSPTLGGGGGGTNKGFGSGYVPSQLEQKPKPSFQVWQCTFLFN